MPPTSPCPRPQVLDHDSPFGGRWCQIPRPPGGTSAWDQHGPSEHYHAVWAASPRLVWIVGSDGTIVRLDGSWSRLDAATEADLLAVWGSSASDVWIAGDEGVVLHWDGTRLTRVSLPTRSRLVSVSGTGPDDVWIASGADLSFDGFSHTATDEVFHLEGGRWRELGWGGQPIIPRAIWSSSPTDVWIAANANDGGGCNWDKQPSLLVWQDQHFLPRAVRGHPELRAIWASGPADVWIVGGWSRADKCMGPWGDGQTDDTPALLQWDGSRMREHRIAAKVSEVYGIWGRRRDDLWLIGYDKRGDGTRLIRWRASSDQRDTLIRATVNAIVGTGPDQLWLVGQNALILHRHR